MCSNHVHEFTDDPEGLYLSEVQKIPPNQKHWHGADPNIAMTHLAISEQLAGRPTDWMEKVSDAQTSGSSMANPT